MKASLIIDGLRARRDMWTAEAIAAYTCGYRDSSLAKIAELDEQISILTQTFAEAQIDKIRSLEAFRTSTTCKCMCICYASVAFSSLRLCAPCQGEQHTFAGDLEL